MLHFYPVRTMFFFFILRVYVQYMSIRGKLRYFSYLNIVLYYIVNTLDSSINPPFRFPPHFRQV